MIPRNPIPEHAKKVFTGKIFDIYQWEQELFDGQKAIFEKAKKRDTAGIIATTIAGKVIVTHQDQPNNFGLVGLPGGVVERGEDPIMGGLRELVEETGYVAGSHELWKKVHPNEKVESWVYHIVARNCKKTGEPHLDPGEKIQVKLVSFSEFVDTVLADSFRDWILKFHLLQELHSKGNLNNFKELIGAK